MKQVWNFIKCYFHFHDEEVVGVYTGTGPDLKISTCRRCNFKILYYDE